MTPQMKKWLEQKASSISEPVKKKRALTKSIVKEEKELKDMSNKMDEKILEKTRLEKKKK